MTYVYHVVLCCNEDLKRVYDSSPIVSLNPPWWRASLSAPALRVTQRRLETSQSLYSYFSVSVYSAM